MCARLRFEPLACGCVELLGFGSCFGSRPNGLLLLLAFVSCFWCDGTAIVWCLGGVMRCCLLLLQLLWLQLD